MMEHFWSGFSKKANLLSAARKGMQAAAKSKNVAQEAAQDLGQYWKKAPTEQVPMWKQKMIAQGKQPATAPKPIPAPAPVSQADQVIQQRRKDLARGGIPHSTFQKALQEPPQVVTKKTV